MHVEWHGSVLDSMHLQLVDIDKLSLDLVVCILALPAVRTSPVSMLSAKLIFSSSSIFANFMCEMTFHRSFN